MDYYVIVMALFRIVSPPGAAVPGGWPAPVRAGTDPEGVWQVLHLPGPGSPGAAALRGPADRLCAPLVGLDPRGVLPPSPSCA